MKDFKNVLDLVLDSNDTTVGGGSASALSGAMACGLIGMTCRLSVRKDFGIPPERQLELADELDSLRDKLLEGVVKDGEAFGVIRDAMKMPRDTEEEKAARRKAMSDAGIVGATAPMENAKICNRVYEIAVKLEGNTNPNLDSDIEIGREMAKIGANGCVSNIEANISLIKDEEEVEKFERAIRELRIE